MANPSPGIARRAGCARDDRAFLAAALDQASHRRDWDDARLALTRPRLCRPPRAERWDADVQLIAARCGVDVADLTGLLAGKAQRRQTQ